MSLRLGVVALGIATPIGTGKQAVAQNLFSGKEDGLNPVGGMLHRSVYVGAVTDQTPEVPTRLRQFDCRNNRLMLAALTEIRGEINAAVARFGAKRIAVVLGTSTAGIAETEMAYTAFRNTAAWPVSYDYRQTEAGGLSKFVAQYLGTTGPAYVLTTACSSSAKVFASARRLIASGIADAAIVGGADSLCRFTVEGFNSLEALSPGRCNPFSVNRDGINIGEGAAAFLLTPDKTEISLLGAGETTDAHHISAPDPSGAGAFAAMEAALAEARLDPEQVTYVNLHGTGTRLNDEMESKALAALFARDMPCSSTKGMTGHMLGAAGACEAAFLWLTLHPKYNPDDLLPPHLWDGMADPALPSLNFISPGSRFARREATAMMSNSYAFGGNNAVLVFGHERGGT